MEKLKIKRKVLALAKEQIEQKITSFQNQMARLENDQSAGEGDSFDLVQKSQNEADHELTVKLTRQLNFANRELIELESLGRQNNLKESVEPGATVFTNQGNFFISVATAPFTVNGQEMLGLSPDAPIYRVMYDKRRGDRFSFRDSEYVIEDLF